MKRTAAWSVFYDTRSKRFLFWLGYHATDFARWTQYARLAKMVGKPLNWRQRYLLWLLGECK